jgi:hypothetical protein
MCIGGHGAIHLNHTEETKKIISQVSKASMTGRKLTSEWRNNISKVQCNKVWITNNKASKFINKNDVDSYVNLGWVLGRIYKRKNI